MNLNHIDLPVSDVNAAREFFENHFGFRCVFQRRNEIAMLEDDKGLAFGVSNLFGATAPPVYPQDFHVGFILENEQQLRDTHARLLAEGVELKAGLSRGGPNLFFVCAGPDGIPIEVRAPTE